MLPTTDMSAQAAAVDFVRRIVPFWQAALGTELLGVYLIGSLAHGGFSRRYSDIDMAVVTEAGLSPQIRNYLGGAPFANWTEQARRFASAEALDPKDHKAYLRTLLYPARLCYSWMTGCMGSNDEAVAFLGKTRPARLDVSLISRALQCRYADADPHSLFPARTSLPSQVNACATLLTGVAPGRGTQTAP